MIKTFVCNLERCKERLIFVQNTYPKILDLEVIEGYDGTHPESNSDEMKNLGILFSNNLQRNIKGNVKNHLQINPHTPGEFGCIVSFLYVLKRIIDSDLEYAIFSDDDMIFEDDFSDKIGDLIKNNLPEDFNVIYLSAGMPRKYNNNNNTQINKLVSIRDLNTVIADVVLLISKEGAMILYDLLMNKFKGKLGRDYAINELCKEHNYVLHIVQPTLSFSPGTQFSSTIR